MATFREKAFSFSRFGSKNEISAQIAPIHVYCLLFDFVCFASVVLHLNEYKPRFEKTDLRGVRPVRHKQGCTSTEDG